MRAAVLQASGLWECSACFLMNQPRAARCKACDTENPNPVCADAPDVSIPELPKVANVRCPDEETADIEPLVRSLLHSFPSVPLRCFVACQTSRLFCVKCVVLVVPFVVCALLIVPLVRNVLFSSYRLYQMCCSYRTVCALLIVPILTATWTVGMRNLFLQKPGY